MTPWLLLWLLPLGYCLVPWRRSSQLVVHLSATRDQTWSQLRKGHRFPVSGLLARSVEPTSQVVGQPAWVEDLGGTRLQVRTLEAVSGQHLILSVEDMGGAFQTRWTVQLDEDSDGCTLLQLHSESRVSSRGFRGALARVLFLVGDGPEQALRDYVRSLAQALDTTAERKRELERAA